MKAGGLSKVNWDRIVSTLNVKSGKNFNIRQARNHWDDLRKKFKIWNEMELNWTGLTFDPITGCPLGEQDDRWNIFVKHTEGVLEKTWNVLASCSFDRLFTFINVGFEGSAHDITVWNHCLTVPEFRFPHPPPGKYYLVDSGYPNTVGYLSPIKDTDIRTHMPEFRNGPPPQGILELFNYLHSSLRTTIERCFGQLKSRRKILTMMPNMDTKHQLAFMVAIFTLHNFIRLHKLDIPIDSGIEIEPIADYDLFNENRKAVMNEVQLNIAKEIWNFL
uniref:DDE Tnp4 domain-containing protein n=1 Tax=Chenopodium quinoa TaxID=63459 RepID=A0A803LJR5_CHEQI